MALKNLMNQHIYKNVFLVFLFMYIQQNKGNNINCIFADKGKSTINER